jgi:hypothetical protein
VIVSPRSLITTVALLAGALVASASGAFAQEASDGTGLGIRLTEAPVELREDPRARVAIVDHVAQGASFSRRFEVVNDTPGALEPLVYVAPATIRNGSFTIGKQGARNEVTRWARVDQSALRLASRASAQVKVTVSVPADAEDGEYYGALVAEVRPQGTGITVASRVGIRIYLAVGKGAVKSDFELTKLTASRLDDGRPVVTAKVHNIGERALDMTGDLKLSNGPGGVKAGPFPAELGTTLAIGATEDVRVVLDKDTPAGPWDAVLTLRSGTIKHAVKGRITFPEIGERPEDIEFDDLEKKRDFGLVAGSLLLLVIAGLIVWYVKRRRDQRAAR